MQLGLLMFPSPTGSAGAARMVEQLGFNSLVFADTQCVTPDVWSQLMLASAATERIEIGTGVTNPVSRDPAVTASAALGLQVESSSTASESPAQSKKRSRASRRSATQESTLSG